MAFSSMMPRPETQGRQLIRHAASGERCQVRVRMPHDREDQRLRFHGLPAQVKRSGMGRQSLLRLWHWRRSLRAPTRPVYIYIYHHLYPSRLPISSLNCCLSAALCTCITLPSDLGDELCPVLIHLKALISNRFPKWRRGPYSSYHFGSANA
jgi:hypothetical protein